MLTGPSHHTVTRPPIRRIVVVIFWVFVASVPVASWQAGTNSSIAAFIGIPLALLGIVAILSEKAIRRYRAAHAFMVAFALWSLASALWAGDAAAAYAKNQTTFQLVLFALLFWQLVITQRDADRALAAYLIGAGVAGLGTIVNYLTRMETLLEEGRFVATGFDPNDLGVTLAVGIPMAWYFVMRRSGILRVMAGAFIPMALICLVLTASRGAALSGLVALAVVPLSVLWGRSARATLAAAVLVSACGWLMYDFAPETSVQRILTIESELRSGNISERLPVWRAGLDALIENPFAGVGSGNYGFDMEARVKENVVAHNTFLSVVAELGIVGFLLFSGILGQLALAAWRAPSLERVIAFGLLLAWAVGASSLTWESKKVTWFVYCAILSLTIRPGPERQLLRQT